MFHMIFDTNKSPGTSAIDILDFCAKGTTLGASAVLRTEVGGLCSIDSEGNLPLHRACELGSAKGLDWIKKTLDDAFNKQSPAAVAAADGPKTFNKQLTMGNTYGYTPLMCAVYQDNIEAVEWLLGPEAGLNLDDPQHVPRTRGAAARVRGREHGGRPVAQGEKEARRTLA